MVFYFPSHSCHVHNKSCTHNQLNANLLTFINDVTQRGGGGVGLFLIEVHKALGIKVERREKGSEKGQICMTTIMNELFAVFMMLLLKRPHLTSLLIMSINMPTYTYLSRYSPPWIISILYRISAYYIMI